MELEIRHLAPYILHGITIHESFFNQYTDSWSMKSNSTSGNIVVHTSYGTYGVHLSDIKPILRPLSDLTKEIEVNGEKFIPIIYLAKIQYPNVDFEIIENECIGRLNEGVVLEFYIDDEIPFYKEFHNNIFGQRKGNDFDDMFLADIKPSELRFKLFEWHFNVFNLSENLYIDINTL